MRSSRSRGVGVVVRCVGGGVGVEGQRYPTECLEGHSGAEGNRRKKPSG